MTDESGATVERNAASLGRLRELAARLSEADLERSLGGGWVVGTAFAHLAFWDRRQAATLRRFVETGSIAAEDDATNEALEPLLLVIDPRVAVAQALEAADSVAWTIAGLDASARAQIEAGDSAYLVRRWLHWEEHLAQIEAGLAG